MAEVRRVKRLVPNRMSGKKRKEIEIRKELRFKLLKERGPWCQAHTQVCKGQWTEMHELLARSQSGDATDPDNILCICRACHTFIHNNPREALIMGLRKTRQVQQ